MISINQAKLIRSLALKKYREKHGMFLLEGGKLILNALQQNSGNLVKVSQVWATPEWISSLPYEENFPTGIIQEASPDELKSLSLLTTAPGVIAIGEIPRTEFSSSILQKDITLVMDSIRDPGNLGTIIRTADWFGFKNIICSEDCVDTFNPKVVQASMGAVLRVNMFYMSIGRVLEQAREMKVNILGTTMKGGNLYDTGIQSPSIVIFGNESTGISEEIIKHLDQEINIPNFPGQGKGSESLNVASSVAILCSEIRRRGV